MSVNLPCKLRRLAQHETMAESRVYLRRGKILESAADEIERLRADNVALKEQIETLTTIATNRGKRLVAHGLE